MFLCLLAHDVCKMLLLCKLLLQLPCIPHLFPALYQCLETGSPPMCSCSAGCQPFLPGQRQEVLYPRLEGLLQQLGLPD